jgi:hypothetical protein
MQRQRGKATQIIDPKTNRTITVHPEHHPVEKAISTILRPSEAIRNAINSAIQSSIITTATATTREGNVLQHKDINNKKEQRRRQHQQQPKFLALHPRIEHDMLQHRCSRFMEQNLTKIFNHLKTTKELLLSSHNTNFNLVFIAVNAELVLVANDGHHQFNSDHIREIALENSIVLNRTRIFGLFGNESGVGIPVFESGSRTAENVSFVIVVAACCFYNIYMDGSIEVQRLPLSPSIQTLSLSLSPPHLSPQKDSLSRRTSSHGLQLQKQR